MTVVHQFVPMLHRHDAVGEHTLALRDLLRRAGVESEIYTELPDPSTAGETRPFTDYGSDGARADVLVYQFATASAMAGWLADRPERLVLNYHSVTPPHFFEPWSRGIAEIQRACLDELALLAPRADLGIAVSEFDRAELRTAGCRRTEVIPVVTAGRVLPPPDADLLARLRAGAGACMWLSVGRQAPNKNHHLAVAALFAYRRTVDPTATLLVVGAPAEPHYAAALRRYAAQLGLADAVAFLSRITDEELAACYEAADVVVMLSGHEGFGVPLVEAMRLGVPVVASCSGAVPEVLGEVGVRLSTVDPAPVAAAVGRLVGDPGARERALAGAHDQLAHLAIDGAGARTVDVLTSLAVP